MAKRFPNHRLVKIHLNYTVEEIALLLNVHKNTVRSWIKDGLPICDDRRPVLILGVQLADFLKARRTMNKQPCRLGEFFCFRCRRPRTPAGSMADCLPVTEKIGHLQAICPELLLHDESADQTRSVGSISQHLGHHAQEGGRASKQ